MNRSMVFLCAAVLLGASFSAYSQDDCLEKGTQLFGQKEYKKAVIALKKCAETPQAQKLLGIACYELNYMEEAKQHLAKAIESMPDDMNMKIRYASSFARGRQFKKAVEEFETLVASYPKDLAVRKGYAQALGWSRNYAKAIAEYRKVLKEDSKDFESWVQVGVLTSWDKKFSDAVQIFKEIVTARPPEKIELDARLHMAEVLSWMKRFEESIGEFDKAIALAPKDARGFLGKGQVQEWQGKYKQAIQTYEKALQAEPGNKDAQARLQQLMWVK